MPKALPLENYWKSNYARFEMISDWKLPFVFSNLEEEYENAQKGLGIFDLSYRGLIKIKGKDRVDILHRLLTNDISSLNPGEGSYVAFLSRTGQVLSEGFIFIFEDHILFDVEMDQAEPTLRQLKKFVITEDVTFEDVTQDYARLGLAGKETLGKLGQRVKGLKKLNLQHAPWEKDSAIIVVTQNFLSFPKFWILAPIQLTAKILEALNKSRIPLLGYQTYDCLRIQHGVPRYGIDFNGETILSETELDRVACSETKGCYPGQEVIARIKTYSGLKQKIYKILFSKKAKINPGDKIFSTRLEEVGQITSYVETGSGGIGLGMIKKSFWNLSPVLINHTQLEIDMIPLKSEAIHE